MDSRFQKFAETLVHYCVGVRPGDKVIIDSYDSTPLELLEAVAREVTKAKGIYTLWWNNQGLQASLVANATAEQLQFNGIGRLAQTQQSDCSIIIKGPTNQFEFRDVSAEQMQLFHKGIDKQITDYRINRTRWVLTRMWTPAMAQAASMSTRAFTDFYLETVLLDYGKMSRAMDPLFELMSGANRVRIISPDTDLTFSIQGIPAIKCDGHCNIPDGEVYTAPVRDSVNGVIHYNTPSVIEGQEFGGIRFEFKAGKIVHATCESGDARRMNAYLDTDEGARYIGEFAIGFNPMILHPMKDILFDEKIAGSLHLTPGRCYEEAPNGNDSAIHWDIVLIQRPEHGGGEIYFDDVLIRKDGLFVPEELQGLNPGNLLS